MAPRTRGGASSSGGAFAPPASTTTFKDLLIFEERLKQNAERLQKQRRKYEAFLIALVIFILYLSHSVLILPSIYSLIHYGNVTLLLVSLVTLVLFFATGMYGEKIAYAYKFVPQANRALRPFNVYLNTRTRSRLSYLNIFRLTSTVSTPTPAAATTSTDRSTSPSRNGAAAQTGPTVFSTAPLRRTTSSSSHSSQSSIGSIRSAGALRSPPPSRSTSPSGVSPVTRAPPSPSPAASVPVRGVPIPPIPPAQNPRGEIIFSSRVSAQFREGYERYRGEWERRRSEAAQAAKSRRAGGWWPFRWAGRTPSVSSQGAGGEKDPNATPSAVESGGILAAEKRGRRTSTPGGSKNSSRQSSPFRPGHRPSASSTSSTSGLISAGGEDGRVPTPTSESDRRSPTYGSKDRDSKGRIRAESFSALLQTMDEGEDGLGALDEVHLVPSGVNG